MKEFRQRPWLITGAGGYLGSMLMRMAAARGPVVGTIHQTAVDDSANRTLPPLDLCDREQARRVLHAVAPTVIIHCAAMADFNRCALDPARARAVNVQGAANLAEGAADIGARLIHLSTDLVFSGDRGQYTEQDVPDPQSEYGRTKYAAERVVQACCENAVIVRPALIFGSSPSGRSSFTEQILQRLKRGETVPLFEDEYRTPVSLTTLCDQLLELALGDHRGVFHLGGPERLSRFQFGRRLASALGLNDELIIGGSYKDHVFADPRPADCSLRSIRVARDLSTAHPPLDETLLALYGEG
ncbi:MAG: NAD(P)-dependent oxidoreductase [Gammaproteobacteria bacterium]|nr:NAD(P)-dependent oxidoreductase [Gammaproteobacteria bacterium]MCP5458375.1 NAD(P)-dependent oxidoreductase [Gammaproteobacteria bacterium]